MNSVKSSWNKFLAVKTFMYIGSLFDTTIEAIEAKLDALDEIEYQVTRTYVGGTTNLKFKTEKGEYSHLDKRGKVFKYGKYFLIWDEAVGNNIIVYLTA